MTISSAEFRSRLSFLGLSLGDLANITGWDLRGLRRQATGVAQVSERTLNTLEQLEEKARLDLARFDDATEDGIPIEIPRLNAVTAEGQMPPSWWHAIAGRLIEKWGEDAQIEYGAPSALNADDE